MTFYYKYIEPNHSLIKKHKVTNLFETTVMPKWQPWLGYAFERFCIKHAMYLAERMGFAKDVIGLGPYYGRKDSNFQVDLVYQLATKTLVIYEVKYHNKAIGPEIIPEIEKKIRLLDIAKDQSIEKAIINPYGIDKALAKSEYFDHVLDINELFD